MRAATRRSSRGRLGLRGAAQSAPPGKASERTHLRSPGAGPAVGGVGPRARPAALRPVAVATALLLSAAGCTTYGDSKPPRTATEQLLVSKAADDAAAKIDLRLPPGTAVFVDASNFEAIDGKYAIGAIRDRLLLLGARLVPARERAEVVVEIRSGASSIDRSNTLVGLPSYDVPIPFAGQFTLPKLALLDVTERQSVAKLVATASRARDGSLVATSGSVYGFAFVREWDILLLYSSRRDNLMSEADRPEAMPLLPDF